MSKKIVLLLGLLLAASGLPLPAGGEPPARAKQVSQPSLPDSADAGRTGAQGALATRFARAANRQTITRRVLHTRLERIDPEQWLGRWGPVTRRDLP